MPLHSHHIYRPTARLSHRFATAGFTLTEVIVVLIVAGILAAYAVPRFSSPAAMTVPQQADTLIRDLRHAQQLALAWNRSLRFTTVANGYNVVCVTAGTAPCNVTPVIDPARAGAFQANTVNGIGLSAATIDFDTLGRPNAAAAITVSGGGASKTVNVAAISGFVSRTP